MGVARVAVALALGAFSIACAAPPNRAEQRPNILLISIDALRADRLEAYGYQRPTSPFLAELGGRGIVFETASVNTHGTTPSHTTIPRSAPPSRSHDRRTRRAQSSSDASGPNTSCTVGICRGWMQHLPS